MRKLLYFVTILGIILLSLTVVVAQDDNWCNPGQPWGDGRCDTPDPSVTAYYWQMGWYMANGVDPTGGSQGGGMGVTDDFYRMCHRSPYISAEEGLLANDNATGAQVISFTDANHGGNVWVWPDGSFELNAPKGEYQFSYTLTGGQTGYVDVNMCDCECKHDPD